VTYEWYRSRLQQFVDRYPSLTVDRLRPYHVQQWVDSHEGIKRTTQRNYFRSIKRCMKWALQQGYIDHNPIAHLEVPGSDRKEVIVSPAEFELLLQHAGTDCLRDLIIVTRETGCRPQESLRVEARHVDLEHSRWLFPQQEAKGKSAVRAVYLNDTALAITKRLMQLYPEGPLFRNAWGNPWTSQAVNCAFDRIRLRIGKLEMARQGIEISEKQIADFIPELKPTMTVKGVVREKTDAELREEAKRKLKSYYIAKTWPRYSLYCLRHTFATAAIQRGVDSMVVGVLLGHKDPSMLARVYQHLYHNPSHLLEQAQKATG
jgi:integrase